LGWPQIAWLKKASGSADCKKINASLGGRKAKKNNHRGGLAYGRKNRYIRAKGARRTTRTGRSSAAGEGGEKRDLHKRDTIRGLEKKKSKSETKKV